MLLLILVGFAHWAIPDSRWLLVHMFTIGLVANSILLWSQTLGERFLGYHLPETRHRLQLVRIYTLNAGLVVTIGGVQLARWPVTLVGAVLIGAVVAWHAVAMALLNVERRPNPIGVHPVGMFYARRNEDSRVKIKVVIHDAEEGGYWAEVPAIPGCATQGETFEELLENLYDAVEGCLSVDLEPSRKDGEGRVLEIAV